MKQQELNRKIDEKSMGQIQNFAQLTQIQISLVFSSKNDFLKASSLMIKYLDSKNSQTFAR